MELSLNSRYSLFPSAFPALKFWLIYVILFLILQVINSQWGFIFRTPDEDFGFLLEAAVMYDRRVAAILNEDDSIEEEQNLSKAISEGKQFLYPRLLFIITGNYIKSPQH